MAIDFIIHDHTDNVGVAVVEGLKAGSSVTGWLMQDNQHIELTILEDIPIGHKIALRDLAPGDTAIKYGADIGKITAPVKRGGLVHIQNLKTKRW